MHDFLFGSLGLLAIISPVALGVSLSQNESSQSNPGVVTKVTGTNGTDISSAFQTMIFQETPRDTLSNLTDRQVPWTRQISTCRHPNAVFQYSYCRRHKSTAADMRAYTVVCKAPPPGPGYFSPRTVLEHGFCTFNEMCMDGPKDSNRSRGRNLPTTATCIGKAGFLPAAEFLKFQQKYDFNLWKHQQTGQLRFSFPDKSSPLKAQNIDVSTISHNATDRRISEDSSCQDCSGLTIVRRDEGVDLLKTQATIQGATAGILWLAFMSGAAMG